MTATKRRVKGFVDSVATAAGFVDGCKLIPGVIVLLCSLSPWIRQHVVFFVLSLGIGGVALAYAIYSIIRYRTWGCARTRKHVREFREDLHPLHPGIRPAVALMAYEVTHALLHDKKGENITLKQYMQLINESLDYDQITDVTFIATTKPEAWDREENTVALNQHPFLSYLWKVYFPHQEQLKMDPVLRVKMRRIFFSDVAGDEEADAQIRKDALAYLTKRHVKAEIDLFLLPREQVPVKMREDLALFVAANGHKWIVSSDYKNHTETVDARVIPEIDGQYQLGVFFNLIEKLNTDKKYEEHVLAISKTRSNRPDNGITLE